MPLDTWQPARLIPTSGINGPDEAERRATSALLAVMASVRDFGAAVIRPFGAPAGQIATFIEVPFVLAERTVIPDGLVETSRAGKTWTALIEVKTGANDLERAQIECYLDVAREQGFDAVITISNQLAPAAGLHPVEVHKAKVRKVGLHHLSWAEVVTLAVTHRVHRGISDPEQAWILGELIRYLEHPKSGALDFVDMGASWVTVREAIAAGTLRGSDRGLPEVVSRWEQLLRFVALRLGRELGADVQVALSRREMSDPSARMADQAKSLVETGTLSGTIRIPNAVAPLEVHADLRANRVTVSAEIEAPREGRPLTRINWLVRQLADAPDGLRIDGLFVGSRTSSSDLLRVIRERPDVLLDASRRDFRAFRIAASSPLGAKRSSGRGGFIDSVLAAVDGFYGGVVQQVRPWSARAPQLPKSGRTAAEESGLDLTPPAGDLVEDGAEISPEDVAAGGGLEVESTPAPDGTEEAADPITQADDTVQWPAAEARIERERGLTTEDGIDRD